MTRFLGVIGYPLGHSLSPVFQQAALDHYGLDVRYEAWPTPPDELAARIASLREADRLGCNVTVPHKQAVMPYLNALDAVARDIGAVNTIAKQGDRLIGYNTDCNGFLRGLQAESRYEPQGGRVLLLGAGGAARAVVYALLQAGVREMTIAARNTARAATLAAGLRASSGHDSVVDVCPWQPEVLAAALRTADLVVNATPLGMLHSPGERASPLDGVDITRPVIVYDLVYNPEETPLLRQARQAGCPVVGGLAMLVYQGAEAFERWLERAAPIEVMFAAARQALSG